MVVQLHATVQVSVVNPRKATPAMRLVVNEPAGRTDRPYARRWWALLVLCLSLLIIVMANTALTVAAPDMTRDLGCPAPTSSG